MIGTLIAALLAVGNPEPDEGYLYKTLLVRAAPGALLEVIDLYKERMPVLEAGGERPFMMRHSQGDQWDLLLLFPMGSFRDYYSLERIARRERAASEAHLSEAEFQRALDKRVSSVLPAESDDRIGRLLPSSGFQPPADGIHVEELENERSDTPGA